jgi:hypothetical protein
MSKYGQVYAGSPTIGYAETKKRHPMKKKLKQKFREWLFDSDNDNESRAVNQISVDENLLDTDRCLKFKVFNASGGRVVETYFYDHHKDRNKKSLYVITSDKDFGHEIDKIITMESLKQ